MRNGRFDAGELLTGIVVVSVALFFPIAAFLAMAGG